MNCFGIQMVLCNLYLKRFDLILGLVFDTVSITVWYKLCRYDHSVLELISFSPPMNWQTEQETSNQMHPGLSKKNMKKMRRRLEFLWNKMCCRQDLSNKMRRRPEFLTQSYWVLCPIYIACNLFFTNHSSESSFFD